MTYEEMLERLRADLAKPAPAAPQATNDIGQLHRAALERAELAEARAKAIRDALSDLLQIVDTAGYMTPAHQEVLRRARIVLEGGTP